MGVFGHFGGFSAFWGSSVIPFQGDLCRIWGYPPKPYIPPYTRYTPHFVPKIRKIRNFILSRLGELLNTLQNVHPRGAPGPPRGGPPGGSPPPPAGIPSRGVGGWLGIPAYSPSVFPQPLFPRDVRGGLFRTQTSLSTRFDQRQVLTHTLTRDWVPSSSQSLRPRHLGRSRGLSHFAPTGWGISSLAGAFPSGGFSPSVYPHQWFPPAFGFTLHGGW